jgi:thioredoxin-related protein
MPLLIIRFLLLILALPVSGYSGHFTMLIFTGSDWCPNCRRLERKILSDSAFINYTQEKLVIEFADFPQHKKLDGKSIAKNQALAERYHFQGIYPTILILDEEGNKKGQIVYRNQNSKEFIEELKGILK